MVSITANGITKFLSEQGLPRSLERILTLVPKEDSEAPVESDDTAESLFHKRLATLVSLPESAMTFRSFRELMFAFNADWTVLLEFRNEWERLLESAIQIQSELSGIDHQDVLPALRENTQQLMNGSQQKWRDELLQGLRWPESIHSKVEAKLAAMPLEQSHEILSSNISQVVPMMAAHMVHQLDTLVDRCVLGQIEWYGEKACQYNFVDRNIDFEGQQIAAGGFTRTINPQVAKRTLYVSGLAKRTVAFHLHDLVDVVCSPISLATAEIPEHARQLAQNVPSVLHGDVKIVEGHLIRERCFELDQEVESWVAEVTLDVPIPFHFDPAIVLAGRYVLVGWLDDPKELSSPQKSALSSVFKSAVNRLFK